MAKKRMPIYGIIGILRAILAHNLVNYQYFLVKLSLFNFKYRYFGSYFNLTRQNLTQQWLETLSFCIFLQGLRPQAPAAACLLSLLRCGQYA